MNCIIVDDEPLAREAMQLLIGRVPNLRLLESFGAASAALKYIQLNQVDLVFLDIQMPEINGIEFSKSIPGNTLVIFTTTHSEYALDGFEVEAVDYLIKPVQLERFQRAVAKAAAYRELLKSTQPGALIEMVSDNYFFIKADRRFIRVTFKEILFIEGLKDYVVIQMRSERIITGMNIKTIHEQMPQNIFVRISKSYIINVLEISSFDNNTVFIGKYEIPIGNAYRTLFFEGFILKKLLSKG
jgi:two-component system LytT family response regulator